MGLLCVAAAAAPLAESKIDTTKPDTHFDSAISDKFLEYSDTPLLKIAQRGRAKTPSHTVNSFPCSPGSQVAL